MNKEQSIPNSWRQVPLSDLFLDAKDNIVGGPFGSNLKSSEYKEEGIPVFRIQNIGRNKFIDKNINFVTEEKAEFLSKHSFKDGDIIITKLGDPLGKACFVPKKYKAGIIVADLIRVRVDTENLNPKFLVYQINSPTLIKQFDRFTKGTTRPRIKLSTARELIYNLPPLNEQQRIVDTIEELFSDLENGIKNLELARNQIKIYQRSLLKYAFEGKFTRHWRKINNPEHANVLLKKIKKERLVKYEMEMKKWKMDLEEWKESGEKVSRPKKPKPIKFNSYDKTEINTSIPKSWAYTHLNDLSNLITDGTHHTPEYTDSGVKFISVKDIYNEKVNFDNCKYISEDTHKNLIERCNPEKGDLLITKSGTIGRLAIVPDEKFSLFVSVALVKLATANLFLNNRWIYYSVKYHIAGLNINRDIKGGILKNYHLEDLRNVKILLCSLHEQNEIVRLLDSHLSHMDNIEEQISIGMRKAKVLKQSILKKAFEGRLVDQNPNDESASELLKRIQKERAEYLKEKKIQKKKVPKKTRIMSKKLSILDVIKASDKPISAKDVWQQSIHKDDIEEFYLELKKVQDSIKEVKKGTESLLSLTK